ncbi:unnamed protein product, partial [Prorocentrum cordatum]
APGALRRLRLGQGAAVRAGAAPPGGRVHVPLGMVLAGGAGPAALRARKGPVHGRVRLVPGGHRRRHAVRGPARPAHCRVVAGRQRRRRGREVGHDLPASPA